MFTEIYVALQQGHVLQQRLLEESLQARRWWPGAILRGALGSR